jgi:hypothetical protein
MEEERLKILCTLAAGVAVTHVADGHLARKLSDLLLIENLIYQALALYTMEFTL